MGRMHLSIMIIITPPFPGSGYRFDWSCAAQHMRALVRSCPSSLKHPPPPLSSLAAMQRFPLRASPLCSAGRVCRPRGPREDHGQLGVDRRALHRHLQQPRQLVVHKLDAPAVELDALRAGHAVRAEAARRAQLHARELEATLALNAHALPEMQASDRLRAGTLVLLPPGGAAPEASASGRKPPPALPHLGEELEVEVDEDGATEWRRAEVRKLTAGTRFAVCVGGAPAD